MPRRCIEKPTSDEPPRKKSFTNGSSKANFSGKVVQDLGGQKWKLGKTIGIGGFGTIYSASNKVNERVKSDSKYVAKIESHSNGPLFVEVNCYLRIARLEMIEEWKKEHKLKRLGMPHFVASGSHILNGNKYRFLIMPKYEQVLAKIFEEKKKLNLKTVLLIAKQILNVLEYIHSKGYIHSDIKASNIMIATETEYVQNRKFDRFSKINVRRKINPPTPVSSRLRSNNKVRKSLKQINNNHEIRNKNGRLLRNISIPFYNYDESMEEIYVEPDYLPEESEYKHDVNQIYLLDYGLASKYRLENGQLRQCGEDERKAHAGTLLYCSRDAHKGAQLPRSDLESLAYNMVHWLTGDLPWSKDLDDPIIVDRKKRRCFAEIPGFLLFCFRDPPRVLYDFLTYIKKLQPTETPDYEFCRNLLDQALFDYNFENNNRFDFDTVDNWKLLRKKHKLDLENATPQEIIAQLNQNMQLLSNMPIKPMLRLRKKIKSKAKAKKAAAALNWSKILVDPETLIKQARERKTIEAEAPPTWTLDAVQLSKLNPTPAMLHVFDRYVERQGVSPRYEAESDVDMPEGYTPEMYDVWKKMIESRRVEEEIMARPKKKAVVRKSRGRPPGRSKEKKSKVTVPTSKRVLRMRG